MATFHPWKSVKTGDNFMMNARNKNNIISCLCVELVDEGGDHQYIYQHVVALLEERCIKAEVLWNDVPTNDRLIALYVAKSQEVNTRAEHLVKFFGEDIIQDGDRLEVIDSNAACLCIWVANKHYYAWRCVVGFLEDEIIASEVYWAENPTHRRRVPQKPYKLLTS